jgi:hypothetical protein
MRLGVYQSCGQIVLVSAGTKEAVVGTATEQGCAGAHPFWRVWPIVSSNSRNRGGNRTTRVAA